MNLAGIQQALELTNLTPEVPLNDSREIAGGYASDLLSDVLAHAPRGGDLVTIQVHLNVLAVAVHAELAATAVHAELAAVIFAADRRPEESVRLKAAEEGVALFVSSDCAFDIAGRLYALGLRGTHE